MTGRPRKPSPPASAAPPAAALPAAALPAAVPPSAGSSRSSTPTFGGTFSPPSARSSTSLYVLQGDEGLPASIFVEKIVAEQIPPGWESVDFRRFDAGKVPLGEILSSFEVFPMGGSRRVIFLSGLDEMNRERKAHLARALTSLPETTLAILWLIKEGEERGGGASPSGARQTASLGKDLDKALAAGEVVKFSFKPAEKVKWLKKHLMEEGASPADQDLHLLLEHLNWDLRRAVMEARKLLLGGEEEFGKRVLEEVEGSQSSTKFVLADAVGERALTKALRSLSLLLDQGDEPVGILGFLASHLRLLWQVKLLSQEGKTAQEIAGKTGAHIYRITRALPCVRRFALSEFPKFLDLLLRADLAIKRGKQEPGFVLEMLLMKICPSERLR